MLYAAPFVLALEVATRVEQAVEHGAPLFGEYTYESRLYTYDQYGLTGRPNGEYEKWSLNSLGMRGPHVDSAPAPGVTRIVCLGASETFGLLEAPGNEWPRQLEAALREQGTDAEVLNAALAGMTLRPRIDHFRHRIIALKPDLAVLMLEYASYVGVARRSASHRAGGQEARADGGQVAAGGVDTSLRLVQKLKDAVLPRLPAPIGAFVQGEIFGYKLRRARREFGDLFQASRTVTDLQTAEFAADVDRFIAAARERGVDVLLLAPAIRLDEETVTDFTVNWPLIHPDWLRDAEQRLVRVAQQVADSAGVQLLNLDSVLGPRKRELMVDSFHFTDEGARAVAAAVAEAVRPLVTR